MELRTLPYPKNKADIIDFVKRHHYSRRCPGVWSVAYAGYNSRGKIHAVSIHGPPPYPSIARRFVRCAEHIPKVSWQSRMIAAGTTPQDIDALLAHANHDLRERGYWWHYTLTDPNAWIVDGALIRLLSPGYTGQVYARNGFSFLGNTRGGGIAVFIINGLPVHPRQGPLTLTRGNVREHYPDATIRTMPNQGKARFAKVLADTDRQHAERTLLMAFRPIPWEPSRQPRLFVNLFTAAQGMA